MIAIYKITTLFRNIGEEKFRELYLEKLLPLCYDLPGFICTDVTCVPSEKNDELNIQYIVEAHFETEEIMNEVLASKEIGEMMQIALKESGGDIFFYTGHTSRYYSANAQKKYNKKDSTGSVLDDYSYNKLYSYEYDTSAKINESVKLYSKSTLN
jgi:hypothetical protein